MKVLAQSGLLIIFLMNSSIDGINIFKKIKVDKGISRGFFPINKKNYNINLENQKTEHPLLPKEIPVQHNRTNPDDKTKFNLRKILYNSSVKSIHSPEKAPLLSRGTGFIKFKLQQPPKKSPTVEQVRDSINNFLYSHVIKRYIDNEGRFWEESFGIDGKKLIKPVFYENGILTARNYTVGERLKKIFGYDNQVKVDPGALEMSYNESQIDSLKKQH